MNYYQSRKEALREEAIEFSNEANTLSWGDLQNMYSYFEIYGKRFGLLREFRENGII